MFYKTKFIFKEIYCILHNLLENLKHVNLNYKFKTYITETNII